MHPEGHIQAFLNLALQFLLLPGRWFGPIGVLGCRRRRLRCTRQVGTGTSHMHGMLDVQNLNGKGRLSEGGQERGDFTFVHHELQNKAPCPPFLVLPGLEPTFDLDRS